MKTPAVNLTLLMVCANSFSKASKLETFDAESKAEIAKSKRLVLSMFKSFDDPLVEKILSEAVTRTLSAEKAIAMNTPRSLATARQLLAQAATRCKVVVDRL